MVAISDEELLNQFADHKRKSQAKQDMQHDMARRAHGFYSGDHMYYQATITDKSGARKSVVFNKVKPYVDAIAGFFIQMRRKPLYQARIVESEQQQQYSSAANGASDYFRENANLDQIESQQDKECVIAGYAAVDTNLNYDNDPLGNIRGENVKFDEVWWDPQAREKNLIDARWAFRKKDYYQDEALKLFKGAQLSDFNHSNEDDTTDWQPNPAGAPYTLIKYGTQADDDLVSVYYYQWWQLEDYYIADNPVTALLDEGDTYGANLLLEMMMTIQADRKKTVDDDDEYVLDDLFKFDPSQEELVMSDLVYRDMKETIKTFNEIYESDISLDPISHKKRCYYTAILSDSKVFKKMKSPDQQGFTIKFKTADFDANNEVWFGIVRQLEEPNKYANKALTEILYIIAATSKAGVMYEEDAVLSAYDFEQRYAQTNAAIKVAPGALSGKKIQSKAVPNMPSGYENVYGMANSSIAEVSGINKEFLGSSENKQVSGVLEEQRIERVVSNLANYIDSIMLYQKEHARLMLTFIRMLAESSEGRLIRIVGEDGSKVLKELSASNLASEYDIDIGEAPTTASQREQTFNLLLQTAELLGEQGRVIIGPIIVDYMPIKSSERAKIKQALMPPDDEAAKRAAQLQEEISRVAIESEKLNQMKTINDLMYTDIKMDKDRAATQKILLESEQKDIENEILATRQVNPYGVNVTI